MMEISKDIPVPEDKRGRHLLKYDFSLLDVNDSFPVTEAERMSVYTCLREYNKRKGTKMKIRTGKTPEGQLRCWRVS